ncbi:hypothetical protein MRX96_057196 [Rhipicephalus microplus]
MRSVTMATPFGVEQFPTYVECDHATTASSSGIKQLPLNVERDNIDFIRHIEQPLPNVERDHSDQSGAKQFPPYMECDHHDLIWRTQQLLLNLERDHGDPIRRGASAARRGVRPLRPNLASNSCRPT